MIEKEGNKPIVVSIHCFTYNHEPYIKQCLEGLVMQKTNFRFEAIVHDDASTDGTIDIIREYAEIYPDIIKPIYENENQYSKFGFYGISKVMYKHTHGIYIAFCEGDDYWIDPYKLQKQVDILNANMNIKLVFSNFQCIDTNNNNINIVGYENMKKSCFSGDMFPKIYIEGNKVMTCTAIYRKEIFENYIYKNTKLHLDYLTTLIASGLGDVHYIDEKLSAYRITNTGLVLSNISFVQRTSLIIKSYIGYYYIKGAFGKSYNKEIDSKIKKTLIHSAFTIYKKGWDKKIFYKILTNNPKMISFLFIIFIDEIKKKVKHLLFHR